MDAKIDAADAELQTARAASHPMRKPRPSHNVCKPNITAPMSVWKHILDAAAQYGTTTEGLTAEQIIIETSHERRTALQANPIKLDEELRDFRQSQAQIAERQAANVRREGLAQRQNTLAEINARLEAQDNLLKERQCQVKVRDAWPEINRSRLDQMATLDERCEHFLRELSVVEAHLKLELEAGAKAEIDGQPVTTGPVRIDATTALVLPGVNRITLVTPEATSMQAELEQSRTRNRLCSMRRLSLMTRPQRKPSAPGRQSQPH